MKTNTKNKIYTLFAVFAVLLTAFTPQLSTYADEADDRKAIDSAISKYDKDAESAQDLITKFSNESMKSAKSDRNNIKYVLYRIFKPQYINDLSTGTLAKDLEDPRYDGKHVCNPDEPNNLLSHNCNVPNFSAELLQNIIHSASGEPIVNGSRTTSVAIGGLGVPKDIPGGKVPVNPSDRNHTYTALELYGYNLKYTLYSGEWDRINTSTSARMLTNFGVMDGVKMVGGAMWEGMKAGLGAAVNNFTINPIRFAANIINSSASASLNSIIDTSELNVISTNSWRRDGFNSTLYNVYVLTDKEVINETSTKYMRELINKFNEEVNKSPELKEVKALESHPVFEYDPNRETEKSKEIRERIEQENLEIIRIAEEDNKKPKLKEVPEPVIMSEQEQLDEWAEENKDIIDRGRKQGLVAEGEITDYDAFSEEWNEKWQAYFIREFDMNSSTIDKIVIALDTKMMLSKPHYDPKQPISHYVCATPDGKPIRDGNGDYAYVYLDYNKGEVESINPLCQGEIREPIGGGFYGSGWHVNRGVDTRHKDNFAGVSMNPFANFGLKISSSIAKLTNVILNLSFSPILESIGLTAIVEELMVSFRDTIFFPLTVIFASVGVFILFFQVMRDFSIMNGLISIFVSLLIFVSGGMILLNPQMTTNLIEAVPNKIDNYIADAIIVNNNPHSYCSTGSKQDGIRTAQCTVWSNSVFKPWVEGQFGTDYENLYAKGYAKGDGKAFNNQNANLVGNARVNRGGGVIENNWALYQLEMMKSGTITTHDSKTPVGVTDPNLYRIVDLQAGPNNGKLSDSSYLSQWAGLGGGRLTPVLLSIIQSVLTLLSVGMLGVMKIEASLMFALSLMFFPVVMLSAFFNRGRKVFDYVARLIGLFLKRIVVVMMLSMLLRMINETNGAGIGYNVATIGTSILTTAFMIYRKELLSMVGLDGSKGGLMSGDPTQMREAISRTTPLYVRNKVSLAKSNARGKYTGLVGGAMGGLAGRKVVDDINKERIKSKQAQSDNYDPIADEGLAPRSSAMKSMLIGGRTGASQSGATQRRKQERSIRRSGFSLGEVSAGAKGRVVDEGYESITNNEEYGALDVFKDAAHHSRGGAFYGGKSNAIKRVDADLLRDKKVQKAVRKEAEERRKIVQEAPQGTVLPQMDKEKIAKLMDEKRKKQLQKDMLRAPISSRESKDYYDAAVEAKKREEQFAKNVAEIKEQLTKEENDDEN